METKEQLDATKERLTAELELTNEKLKHIGVPDEMRKQFELGFGWPKLAQELLLEKKLDKETFNALYKGMKNIVEDIVKMVPKWEDVEKSNKSSKLTKTCTRVSCPERDGKPCDAGEITENNTK